MPTADRRRWVPYAIDYFLRQDHPARELVVLDDGDDAIEDLIPPDERVRYLRTTRCASLGAKRNLCVEAARGDVLLHWDDDDWMAPQRIRRQLDDLRASGAEVGGMRRLVYHRLGTPETFVYDYPPSQRPWVVGCTLIYSRDVWRRSPFPGVTVGEDTRFLFSQRLERLAVTEDDQLYVGMIHPHNTGPKTCRGPFWSRWPGDVRTILGTDAGRYLGPA
jgi:glycosyltransferase involved in cell wall biosynthesis